MSKYSLHNGQVEIPLQGMEFVRFSTCGGLWGLRTINLFVPPLNKLCFNSIPCKGISYNYMQFNLEKLFKS